MLVTDKPTDLTAKWTGYNTVKLSWTAPAKNTPPVASYEVFFKQSGSDSVQSGANTTYTNVVLMGIELWSVCELFVVAYSDVENALPSAPSSKQGFELGELEVL